MIELSIIVPTYNRNAILRENLSRLLPQVNSACRIVIIDNESRTPVEETLRDLLDLYENRGITIIRNKRNIGGNANIARCFELCESEWLWILGDDDRPNDDAIEVALRAIREAADDCVYQNFATPGKHLRPNTFESQPGLEQFLTSMDDLGNCMFISSCLFRAGVMSREVQFGFTFATTMIPHLLIAMLAIKRLRGRASFHRTALVTCGDAEDGGRHFVILAHLGLGLLGSLPLFEDRERTQLRARIKYLLSGKALVAHIAFGRLHGEISYRAARSMVSRCAAEPHYRATAKCLLVFCRWAGFLIFSRFGCKIIVTAVDWLQRGKRVRIRHVSTSEM